MTLMADILVVAGGGGGGANNCGGGGGAGGVIIQTIDLDALTFPFDVIVGAGGGGVNISTSAAGGDGGDSSFGAVVATGGGGGGRGGFNISDPGNSGGSGGGGGGTWSASANPAGGSGTVGQGNDGGDGRNTSTTASRAAGGGGGAGGAGSNAGSGSGGGGGIGVSSDISGTTTYYGGGGGGSSNGSGVGSGGQGGGGNGSTSSLNATSGQANTGGGGGGLGEAGPGTVAGDGGSGIVIVKYAGDQVLVGGTVVTVAGYTTHTFISGTTSVVRMVKVRAIVEHVFSLPERLTLHHVFGDAARLRKTLYHVFGDMLARRKTLHHNFGDAILLRKTYEHVFSMPDLVRKVLYHDFAITSAALRKVTYHDWSIEDVDHLRKTIHQVFGLLGDSGELLTYTVSTKLDGETVDNPAVINLERDIDLYYIDCTLTIGGQQQWARYRRGQRLDLSVNGTVYNLLVTRPQRTRQHGSSSYSVVAQSPAVTLGKGWAEPVEGELVGFASQIAASLAPGFAIAWQIHDEYYGPGECIAAGEYPIELIVRLAAAMKGAVQSNRDGSLKVIRRRIRRDRMADMTPDYTLADAEDWFTVSETPEYMEGYNKFTIGSQNQAAVGLRLEQEAISKTEKLVRGYQTPWTGNFDLTHTGGTWVYIVPEGIEERQLEEVVEFVDGKGSTRYPIYSWSAIEWQQNNLGTVTFSEDGSLESTVAGDSLLAITYRTRCKLWRVRDSRNEQLQLVSEEA